MKTEFDDAVRTELSIGVGLLEWGLKKNGYYDNSVVMRDEAIAQILKWRNLQNAQADRPDWAKMYKDWSGETHTTNSCHAVHDSAEAIDFAQHCVSELF